MDELRPTAGNMHYSYKEDDTDCELPDIEILMKESWRDSNCARWRSCFTTSLQPTSRRAKAWTLVDRGCLVNIFCDVMMELEYIHQWLIALKHWHLFHSSTLGCPCEVFWQFGSISRAFSHHVCVWEGGDDTRFSEKGVTNFLALELSPRLLDQILNNGFKFDLVLL